MTLVIFPIAECLYATPDTGPAAAEALITVHATVHNPGISATTTRVKKVKRQNGSSSGPSKNWQYFTSHWEDYVKATNLAGAERQSQTSVRVLR